jgi:type II secretory pathway predicted ATPase ExeA
MYESFYGFREKPFSLLPDAGFLYFSNKHRMALTLLEYGIMNQAGFTVISGDIGTGKTTLIRQLLNNIDPLVTVGLISNTHQTFGDLMQWIALAFNLPHQGKDKVQLYHEFMDFVIGEYSQGRRTVLIVDESQNMSAETLEELRMLSNVNADKDQVLQVVLVGQRELRDTLRRPDLVQFAQRIAVDYHLEPLTAEETRDYIRHRCKVAGGSPDLFSDQACQAVFERSGGVPRLINLLCDTALVYGYAEQRDRIDAKLIHDVAADKQQGGLFPGAAAPADPPAPADSHPKRPATTTLAVPGTAERHTPEQAASPAPRPQTPVAAVADAPRGNAPAVPAGDLRIAIISESELLRIYLSKLLSKFAIRVSATLPLEAVALANLDTRNIDVLLVELDEDLDELDETAFQAFNNFDKPILFNDSLSTQASLSQPNRLDYGRSLSQKLHALVPQAPQSVA